MMRHHGTQDAAGPLALRMRGRSDGRGPALPPGGVPGRDARGTRISIELQDELEAVEPGARRELRELVARRSLVDVAEALSFSTDGYTRTRLALTTEAEALLLGWLPGQASLIHDHGASSGYVKVLCGNAVEERFREAEEGIVRVGRRVLGPGDLMLEAPGDIHRVRAFGDGPLVTLNVYTPKLEGFRTFPG